MCLSLQEEIIPFFQQVRLPQECTTVYACYLDLAEQVRDGRERGA